MGATVRRQDGPPAAGHTGAVTTAEPATPSRPAVGRPAPGREEAAYRVLAVVVGVALLVLVLIGMPLKYGFDSPGTVSLVGAVHGMLLYPLYVLLVLHLGFRRRWGLAWMLYVALAGTVPFLGFVAERQVAARMSTGDL